MFKFILSYECSLDKLSWSHSLAWEKKLQYEGVLNTLS